jgi:F0F1-type ATP synthase membrane subunit b/b'
MIGVNFVSFAPIAAVVLFGVYSVLGPASGALLSRSAAPTTTVGSVDSGLTLANTAKQQARSQNERVQALNEADVPAASLTADAFGDTEDSLEEIIAESEAARTAAPESEPGELETQSAMVRNLIRSGFLIAIGLLLSVAWAVFFFPAASAVAGYTRSLGAVLNITVGLDTIRRLGGSYVKVVAIFILISVTSFVATALLHSIFAPLDLPMLGNIPATAISSFFSFYLSIVFACVLGLALYRRADKLELPQG